MRAPSTSKVFAQVSGENSANIRLLANAFDPGQEPLALTGNAKKDSAQSD